MKTCQQSHIGCIAVKVDVNAVLPQADQAAEEDEDPTAAAFKAAALVLKSQQEEQKMSIEQRITK